MGWILASRIRFGTRLGGLLSSPERSLDDQRSPQVAIHRIKHHKTPIGPIGSATVFPDGHDLH